MALTIYGSNKTTNTLQYVVEGMHLLSVSLEGCTAIEMNSHFEKEMNSKDILLIIRL